MQLEGGRTVTDETSETGSTGRKQALQSGSNADGQTLDAGRTQRAFLAYMRHELRTPINAIVGYSEMLLEDMQEQSHSDLIADLQRIHAAGKQLLALVNDILDPAKVEQMAIINLDALGTHVRHAMRTPINAVIGYCEMLIEDAAEDCTESVVSDLEKIHASGQRLLALIEDIVSLSSVELGKADVDMEPSGVSTLIRDVVTTIRPLEGGANAAKVQQASLLIVDDNETDRDLLARRLEREGYMVTVADNGRQALGMLKEGNFDLVLLDIIMPEMNGYQVLEHLKADKSLRTIPVIMLSALDEIDSLVRCIEMGAEDYLPKPFNPSLLRARIGTCLEKKRLRDREVTYLRQLEEEKSERYGDLVGKQPSIKELQQQIQKQAQRDSPLLVQGERGAGKELIARLIHSRSQRKDSPLLSVDCAQVAETQWGDPLFGDYHHGEAKRSHQRSLCYMELVDGGTVLLKNIDALPLGVQERLARFLEKDPWLLGGLQYNVRVIATCRGSLTDMASAGKVSPSLTAALSQHVLTVPPLRERKRDISELAAYFVRKHAQRLNKKVKGLNDQAVIRLVSYDYLIANVQELEETIERAVVLTDNETVSAEEIFLEPPPVVRPRGVNLLNLPKPLVQLALKLFPTGVRVLAALIFAFILYQCFFVPAGEGGNIGTLLVWSLWWPALVLSFFFAGRAWCAICPMASAGAVVQRVAKLERHIPGWLKNRDAYIVMAGFFGIVWVEEVTGMRHAPHATGVLLLFILSGAITASVLFPRRTWCRHLCPLGGFAGLCSVSALVELRPTSDVCAAKCKGHSCYKGNESVAGCPMFNHVMFVDSNQHCAFCLNCVRSCPNGSPQLNVRVPARELWSSLSTRSETGVFVAMLAGLLIAQMFIQHWERQSNGLLAQWLDARRFVFLSGVLALGAILPLLSLWVVTRQLSKSSDSSAAAQFWQKVAAWVPLVLAGFVCYQLAFVPGLDGLRSTFDYQPLSGRSFRSVSFSVISVVQSAVLSAGLMITMGALWKHGQTQKGGERKSWIREQVMGWTGPVAYWMMILVLMLKPDWLAS